MKSIESVTVVDAPIDTVWNTITDFATYEEWNPFIVKIQGAAVAGARLRVTFQLANRKPLTLSPTVTTADAPHRLAWHGRLVIPKLFDGDHSFELRTVEHGTEVVHCEEFRGALVPLARGTLRATEHAFAAMDSALADRVSALA
jgi:hypothetical protein